MSEYRLAEKPTLDVLTALGYRPLSPEAAMAMREEENRVILKPVLVEALQTLNGIGATDAEAIYADLSRLSDNEDWQRKLRGAYSRKPTGEPRERPISLIDFKHPDRNRYHVVRQFRVASQRPRIADIVVFVNGIPLIVIEAKSPLKATARAEEEWDESATCKPFLQVRTEGSREVSRQIAHYSLPMILAVGFRVRSRS